MSNENRILSDDAARFFDRLLGKNNHIEQIGQKDTLNKHNILFKVEETHHQVLYGTFKKICKHYKIKIPIENEIALYCHNQIIPRLYQLAQLNGTDLIESSKNQIDTIAGELDKLLMNKQTEIQLKNNKENVFQTQNELLEFEMNLTT